MHIRGVRCSDGSEKALTRIVLESRIPRHVRMLHENTVDVLFVYLGVIQPVFVVIKVNVVVAMAHIMLHYAINITR